MFSFFSASKGFLSSSFEGEKNLLPVYGWHLSSCRLFGHHPQCLSKDSSKLDSLKNPSVKSISSSCYNITNSNGLPDDHIQTEFVFSSSFYCRKNEKNFNFLLLNYNIILPPLHSSSKVSNHPPKKRELKNLRGSSVGVTKTL